MLIAVTNLNPNTCMVFEFLNKIIKLGQSYFGKFNEETVKNNFTLVYELFDGNFGVTRNMRLWFPTNNGSRYAQNVHNDR
jgi:AP-2 complex subunit mu-1